MEFTINQYYDSQDHICQSFQYDDNDSSKVATGLCYLQSDNIEFRVQLSSLSISQKLQVIQSGIEIIRPPYSAVDFKYKLVQETFDSDGIVVSYSLNYTKNYMIRYTINTLLYTPIE